MPWQKLLYPRLFSHGSAQTCTTKAPMAGPSAPPCRPSLQTPSTMVLRIYCRASDTSFFEKAQLCRRRCVASFVRVPRDTSRFVVTLWFNKEMRGVNEKLTFQFNFSSRVNLSLLFDRKKNVRETSWNDLQAIRACSISIINKTCMLIPFEL